MADTDAEDVVQETLLAIHLKRQSWDEEAPFGPWLRAIARHKMIDALRRRGRRISLPIDDFADVLADGDSEPACSPVMSTAISKTCRLGNARSCDAIAVDGASIGEAGGRFSMTNGAVRVTLHRGPRALARKFKEGEP